MPTLTLTRGLPASGKTTWAKAAAAADPSTVRISRDELRAMMHSHNAEDSNAIEMSINAAEQTLIHELLVRGFDIIVDACNLRPRYLRQFAALAAKTGAEFKTVEFPIDIDTAIARDAARAHSVGEHTIRRMSKYLGHTGQLLPMVHPNDTRTFGPVLYQPSENSIPAIIVDLDGTLALMGDRKFYELTRVGEDAPNPGVIAAVRAMAAAGYQVLYCSGREDSCRDQTLTWLAEHVGIDGPLFMRATGDNRRDSIIKMELFDAHIRDHYDIACVFDDRDQVVQAWRKIGLTVFQVAEGDF